MHKRPPRRRRTGHVLSRGQESTDRSKCRCTIIVFAILFGVLPICFSVIYFLDTVRRIEFPEEQFIETYLSVLSPRISYLQQQFQHQYQQQLRHLQRTEQFRQLNISQLNDTESLRQLQEQITKALQEQMQLLSRFLTVGRTASSPIPSCSSLPLHFPSGYYFIRAPNGSGVRHYCEMNRPLCGVVGGWTRIAILDMNNVSQQCPAGLDFLSYINVTACVRPTISGGCSSIFYNRLGIEYRRVCGRVNAYQIGSTDAFNSRQADNIDEAYVDGVSVTYGNPRQHIWTFAASSEESPDGDPTSRCPCIMGSLPPPVFVRDSYFCDVAGPNNRLWDGAGCEGINQCCGFNNPPWFYRELPQTSTESIELRVCRDQEDEDIAMRVIEIYVW